MMKVRNMFENIDVERQKNRFAMDICRHIVWALHDAMVEYFTVRCCPADFSQGAMVEWSEIDLSELVQAVRYVRTVELASFPME